MIKSMTGYAAAEKTVEEISVAADMRAYNSRHLDIVLRIPPGYTALEEKMKRLIASRIARGRVEIRIQIKDESEQAIAFEIDRPRAQAIHAALEQLKDLEIMRQKEGDFIAGDLSTRLDFIAKGLAEIKSDAEALLPQYQERLKERIAALTRETVEIDPGRLAQEAAFLADRSDISEEIVRVGSHVKQFRHIMKSEEPGGRKLNFLLQELNREKTQFFTAGAQSGI